MTWLTIYAALAATLANVLLVLQGLAQLKVEREIRAGIEERRKQREREQEVQDAATRTRFAAASLQRTIDANGGIRR